MWIGRPLHSALAATVCYDSGCGPLPTSQYGLYAFIYQLSFRMSFWDFCVPFVLFVLCFVMMRSVLCCLCIVADTVLGSRTIADTVAGYHN